MTRLKINGEEREVSAGSVEELLGALKLSKAGVAVELNGEIVRRESYGTSSLKDGDVLEIVSLVGGG